MSFNNNPNIQSYQYFALSASTGTAALYTIYNSYLSSEPLSFSNPPLVNPIQSGTCFDIDTIMGDIIVTCLTTTPNQLTYIV